MQITPLDGEFTLYHFHQAPYAWRMDVFRSVYANLAPVERAYVDEALDRIIDHVKRKSAIPQTGYVRRFSTDQALETLGTVMLFQAVGEARDKRAQALAEFSNQLRAAFDK